MKSVTAILLFCSGVSAQTAAEYMSAVNSELKLVQEASWQYVESATGESALKAEKKRQEFLFKVGIGIVNLSGLPPYQSNTALRDSAVSFLKVTQAVMNEDYARVINLEPIAESAFDAMEAFILARERAEHRLALAGQMMEIEYKKFGDMYGMVTTPEHNPLAGHLSEAGTAFNYYNGVYALFFRNYKQESYFLDALGENDISAADQNRCALAECANRSLTELKTIPAYKNDEQLKQACLKLIAFYRDEATQTLSLTAQYMVDRDNHQKLRDAYESKKPGERTAEDEKLYIEASKNFEKQTVEFRKRYALAESKRQSLLKNWNKAGERFVRRYVP